MNPNIDTAVDDITLTVRKDAALSDSSFESWRKYIYDASGIYLQDNKKNLFKSRMQKRMAYLGIDSFDDYFDYVRFDSNSHNEKEFLYEAIIINETFFFRNKPQYDALVQTILPEIITAKRAAGRNKIRIWSAASSSGEEAYTISMIINDLVNPRYTGMEYEITGTDINRRVIETAKRGIYKEYSIRNMPVYYLKKYFKKSGNEYELDEKIKKIVSFKQLNLYDSESMKEMFNFDVIFCANALVYFDIDSKIKVVSNLYNALNPNGYLFIGYSETLRNISKAFKLVSFPKTIGYKKEK